MKSEMLFQHLQAARRVDLTYPFAEGMPYWPGRLQEPFTHIIEEVRPRVWGGCFTLAEHMGTHVDAPRHFVADGRTTGELRLDEMILPGVVIDISEKAERDPDYSLSVDDIIHWERQHGQIPTGATVFLHSGWGRRWNDGEAYLNKDAEGVLHFPGYSGEAARFLVEERGVTSLGLDTLSADNMVRTLAEDSPVHRVVHESDGLIIENLARLERLPVKDFIVIVAPVPIQGGTGAPARVLAIVP